MWHVGIDLHRQTVVIAAVDDSGTAAAPVSIACQDAAAIDKLMRTLQPFRAVIEATGTYRWLYDLLSPLGTVLLAHPLRLRAMVQRRSKTDKLDSQLLANLLRINQIPLAYIPPENYQQVRELTRHRARLSRQAATAKTQIRGLLARHNLASPYRSACAAPFRPGLSLATELTKRPSFASPTHTNHPSLDQTAKHPPRATRRDSPRHPRTAGTLSFRG